MKPTGDHCSLASDLDDRVLQDSDSFDLDSDEVPRLKGELLLRNDAGSRQDHRPVGHRVVPA